MRPSTRIACGHEPPIPRFLALALTLATVPFCGCVSAPVPPPSTATLLEWALGSDTRGEYPATADAYLLLLPKGQPPERGTRITPDCANITSILPVPLDSSWVFVVRGGALHVLRPSDTAPVPLKGDSSLHLDRLLGFRAAASPLEILAVARPHGVEEDQMWSLTVSDTEMAITGAKHLTDEQKPRTEEEFFAAYRSPRCQPGGTQCLVLSSDGDQRYVDVEPKRHAKPEPWQSLGATDVRDVAWKPGAGPSLYLLVGCSR